MAVFSLLTDGAVHGMRELVNHVEDDSHGAWLGEELTVGCLPVVSGLTCTPKVIRKAWIPPIRIMEYLSHYHSTRVRSDGMFYAYRARDSTY